MIALLVFFLRAAANAAAASGSANAAVAPGSATGAEADVGAEATPTVTGPTLSAAAALQMGLTSNLQRAKSGGEADGLLDVSGGVQAAAWRDRLEGSLDLGLRQPLGLPEARGYQVHGDGLVEIPAGPVFVGAALQTEAERTLTVFTETGTLGTALSRTALGARLAPLIAWAPEPFRVELSPVLGARSVTGAETYTLSDLGGRLAFRWFDTPLFHAGVAAHWHARRFDGLNARTRDGNLPNAAPAVSLNVFDGDLNLGSHPLEALDLGLRLGVSRVFDRFDGYHSHVELNAALQGVWQPERGLGAELGVEFSRRTYGTRVVSTAQSGDESEFDTLAGLTFKLRPWLIPALDYELHFAEAAGRGHLFTEHVGLLGLRGRY